ncbi:MAG: fumarate hydratase C-terminal domain-containing protein [Deltaproteobacteria bacterium]|nr:fumarate hydratase C-terminal domain-containing protein [Deltaproteobacteria bacterium]MBW1994897.1 fumarate hydratase C-terminal domain-containing protein [Deltaproteobacteria bacterium]MBW2153426.1 fumarate hydratase C-terminal domain-containing protein [Deltaproteobacteria bacterium]
MHKEERPPVCFQTIPFPGGKIPCGLPNTTGAIQSSKRRSLPMADHNTKNIREVNITLPLSEADSKSLALGDAVFLNGLVFTGREGLYRQIFEKKIDLPIDIQALGGATFHCSPAISETAPGVYRVPSVTATASFRFAKYMPEFLKRFNIRVVIGKGGMSSDIYKAAFKPNGAIYLTTVGYGLGAIYGRGILGVKDVVWKQELGLAQAMWILEVRNFGPFLVECDANGESLFEQANKEINEKFLPLYNGLPQPALKRVGEVTSASEEML